MMVIHIMSAVPFADVRMSVYAALSLMVVSTFTWICTPVGVSAVLFRRSNIMNYHTGDIKKFGFPFLNSQIFPVGSSIFQSKD